jgi:hypothetical protein
MRFQKGIHFPHPPRGPARKPYTMTPEALRARRRNFAQARSQGRIKLWRSHDESKLIKLLIWQAGFGSGPPPSQRALGRQLGVRHSYVHKVQHKVYKEGMDALGREEKWITPDDLAAARRVSARLRERAPDLFATAPQPHATSEPRVMTADDLQWEAQELIRQAHKQNPGAQPRTMQEWQELERRGGRRTLIVVPLPYL